MGGIRRKTLDELAGILGEAFSIVPTSDNNDVLDPDRHGVYSTPTYTYSFFTKDADGTQLVAMVGIEKT